MAKSFDELVNKTILVGLTHVNDNNEVLGHSEYFGKIIEASHEKGVVVYRYGVRDFTSLPPLLENYIPGRKGKYTLKSSGLVIENPDFTCTWRVNTSKK